MRRNAQMNVETASQSEPAVGRWSPAAVARCFLNAVVAPSELYERSTLPLSVCLTVLALVVCLTGSGVWAFWAGDTGLAIKRRQNDAILELASSRLREAELERVRAQLPSPAAYARDTANQTMYGLAVGTIASAVVAHFLMNVVLGIPRRLRDVVAVFAAASPVAIIGHLYPLVVALGTDEVVVGTLGSLATRWPDAAWIQALGMLDLAQAWYYVVVSVGLGRLYGVNWKLLAAVVCAGHMMITLLPHFFLGFRVAPLGTRHG